MAQTGIVNFLFDVFIGQEGGGFHQYRCLRCREPCNFLPALEALDHLLSIGLGGEAVASRSEMLGEGTICGEKPLCMPYWGSRRYQRKIFGKEESDEITVGRQARLHPKKQDVVLYVTSHAERDVTVLDSKTGSVTPVYRPS